MRIVLTPALVAALIAPIQAQEARRAEPQEVQASMFVYSDAVIARLRGVLPGMPADYPPQVQVFITGGGAAIAGYRVTVTTSTGQRESRIVERDDNGYNLTLAIVYMDAQGTVECVVEPLQRLKGVVAQQ